MPPKTRLLILISIDSLLISLSIFITLRFKTPFNLAEDSIPFIYQSSLIISIIIYSFTGLYNGLTRYIDSFSLYKLSLRNFSNIIYLKIFYSFLKVNFFNLIELIILFCVLTSFSGLGRFVLRESTFLCNKS